MNWNEIIQIALLALCPIMMILCCGRMIFGGTGGTCGRDEPKDRHERSPSEANVVNRGSKHEVK
jgi:hypothetical protein